jgi:hypothetical protein
VIGVGTEFAGQPVAQQREFLAEMTVLFFRVGQVGAQAGLGDQRAGG